VSALTDARKTLAYDFFRILRAPLDELPHQPFDARKFEYHFPTVIAAKLAIADDLAIPLARMPDEDRAFIDSILAETLNRNEVLARIRDYFRNRQPGEDHAG
ncbi:hypothetical protein P3S44_25110, partial [Enterobacter hormaechei]|nr:hypothetical protein [Enterobacter hormaechei]MDF3670213.1 hypothetical protein [Enterobacter hormaechei]